MSFIQDIKNKLNELPPYTRYYLVTSIIVTVLIAFGIIP